MCSFSTMYAGDAGVVAVAVAFLCIAETDDAGLCAAVEEAQNEATIQRSVGHNLLGAQTALAAVAATLTGNKGALGFVIVGAVGFLACQDVDVATKHFIVNAGADGASGLSRVVFSRKCSHDVTTGLEQCLSDVLLYHLPHLWVGAHSSAKVLLLVVDECVVDYKCHTIMPD